MAAGDGLVSGAWTQQVIADGSMQVWKSHIVFTTSENDAYTPPIPKTIDTTKRFEMMLVFAATPDNAALPLDIWAGYGDSFAVAGDGASNAATNGFKLKQLCDDVVLAVTPLVYHFTLDPDLPVADVIAVANILNGFKVRIPKGLRIAFNLNGAGTLNATNCDFYIIQTSKH